SRSRSATRPAATSCASSSSSSASCARSWACRSRRRRRHHPTAARPSSCDRFRRMIIDLRSDTVTRPTPAMREAMARAEVGDDVYGEDPTVNRLQERVAELVGTEAALYVPSGSMANQIALKIHTNPGDDVLVSEGSHNLLYESGGAGGISG